MTEVNLVTLIIAFEFICQYYRFYGEIFPWQPQMHSQTLYNAYHIKAGPAFVVVKEVFNHKNGNILKLWEWLNDEKLFFVFTFNHINKHLHSEKNFKYSKLTNTNPCNFLNKRALMSQPSTLSNISLYWNLSINSTTIMLHITKYTPNMIVPRKWTQIW